MVPVGASSIILQDAAKSGRGQVRDLGVRWATFRNDAGDVLVAGGMREVEEINNIIQHMNINGFVIRVTVLDTNPIDYV